MRAAALVALGLAACTLPPTPHAPVAKPTLSTAELAAMSHAVLDAYDRGDTRAIDAVLSAGFVRFDGAPQDRTAALEQLRARPADAPHIAHRTFSNEHSFVTGDAAVYIGEADERGAGTRGSYVTDGYYAFSWHRERAGWRLALWTWKRAGKSSERDVWDDVFTQDVGFEHAPNRLLVDSVANVTPGTALDVAMGQGRNALYLASKGWKVTGVDWSSEGIAHARAEAAKRGLALDAVDTDIGAYDFGAAKWDLVTMIYAGNDKTWLAKIKTAIKPGGLLVVEYFHDAKHGGATDVPGDLDGFATGELRGLFGDAYDILRDDVVEDTPDWAMDRATLVRFVARRR